MVFDKDRTKQENTPTFRCAMIGHFADTQDPENMIYIQSRTYIDEYY